MGKLSAHKVHILRLIANADGSWCPAADIDPYWTRTLHELVKAKRLTVEPNDGAPPRYVLTAQGREDANG